MYPRTDRTTIILITGIAHRSLFVLGTGRLGADPFELGGVFLPDGGATPGGATLGGFFLPDGGACIPRAFNHQGGSGFSEGGCIGIVISPGMYAEGLVSG